MTETIETETGEIDRLRQQLAQLRSMLNAICPPGPHFYAHEPDEPPEPTND